MDRPVGSIVFWEALGLPAAQNSAGLAETAAWRKAEFGRRKIGNVTDLTGGDP